MKYRLLDVLICPECGSGLKIIDLALDSRDASPRSTIRVLRCEKRCAWGEEDIRNQYQCSDCLLHDIRTGLLYCDHDHLFPIVRGIPRMLPNALSSFADEMRKYYMNLPEAAKNVLCKDRATLEKSLNRSFSHIQRSFSSEWSEISEKTRPWGMGISERRELFLRGLNIDQKELAGSKVLDAGCGHGEVELALAATGSEIFALDLSYSVDQVQASIHNADITGNMLIHVVQGNICELPFRKEVFDYVHSSGVLHHLPDTYEGFKNIAAALKKGGKCYIFLYGNETKTALYYIFYLTTSAIRVITKRLPPGFLHILCYGATPLFWVFTRVFGKRNDAWFRTRTLRELELSLFDSFSPRYQWHHTLQEVKGWYETLNFKDIYANYESHVGFGCVGIKK